MSDYEKLIARINERSNPENLAFESDFVNEMLEVKYGDVEKYIRLAMRGVEPEYTQRSREAGNRVKNHLKEVLTEVTYKYQGSVETNTHIKATSDIDLLVITDRFYTPDRSEINAKLNFPQRQNLPQKSIALLEAVINAPSYTGNPEEDLSQNRLKSERKLQHEYLDCRVIKPKAITIKNKSLKREVDVVIASWFDNANAILNNQESDYRGVQIYNKDEHKREAADFPFLKIKLVNERSTATNGRLKKMIRFLKNIRADINHGLHSKPITLSSFQFNAICYDIEMSQYKDKNIFELVAIIFLQLNSLVVNDHHRNNLMSVDGSEPVFRDKPSMVHELKLLKEPIQLILSDLQKQKIR